MSSSLDYTFIRQLPCPNLLELELYHCGVQLCDSHAHLGLRKLTLDSISGNWPQQLSAYSALTASSNLQELHIYDSSIPGAALAHVFPAGRQLPKLRTFTLLRDDHSLSPVGSADITRLVSCCPAVEDLVFTPAANVSLAPLQSLTALTHLHINPVSPVVICSNLTALSQLRRLFVSLLAPGAGGNASSWLQHLVPLTALTGMTSFCGHCDGGYVTLSSTAPAGSAPDVWVQLLEHCAKDPAAQPAVISSVVRQLQQQREQVAAARAEAAAAAAEAAELCGRMQALEGRQEQEVAAARAEAAELRSRVQALGRQLQEVLAALRR